MEICKYGEGVLKIKAEQIKDINENIKKLVDAMRDTLYNTPGGIGLAAPQVGESLQLAIIDPSMQEDEREFMVLINPKIVDAEGNEIENEGCLSVPGFSLPIDRSIKILISAYDLKGKEIKREYEGFKARVIQHEVDHLQGVLILDRVSRLKRQLIRREINKLRRNGQW